MRLGCHRLRSGRICGRYSSISIGRKSHAASSMGVTAAVNAMGQAMLDMQDAKILVTGAGSDIGAAIVIMLAAFGSNI